MAAASPGDDHPLAELGRRLAGRGPGARARENPRPRAAVAPGKPASRFAIVIEAPGKIPAWNRILERAGLDAVIHATGGHVLRNPASLFPCGIVPGPNGRLTEPSRLPSDYARRSFIPSLAASLDEGMEVVMATDPDMEGDVIADDVFAMIREISVAAGSRHPVWRLRMQGLTYPAFQRAFAAMQPMNAPESMRLAAPGRTRAAIDRIISSTWTRPGAPAGRVMTPLLASIGSHRTGQQTGEIRLTASAADGGRPFLAIIPLYDPRDTVPQDPMTGDPDARRLDPQHIGLATKLAGRFAGGLVPGYVRRIQGAGAAVTARFGPVPCHATEDILIAASRLTGMPVTRAERALQRLYQKGEISYPRTDERGLTPETSSSLVSLARNMGVSDFDPAMALASAPEPVNHQGLHPIIHGSPPETARLSQSMAERALRAIDLDSISSKVESAARDEADNEAIFSLIARRAVEAGLDRDFQRGQWLDFDGVDDHAAGLSDEEVDLLADLDWFRESGRSLPWSRMEETGLTPWPLDGQIVHAATLLGLGRPSTHASQAAALLRNRFLKADGMAPILTPEGEAAVMSAPAGLRNPAFAHLADAAIAGSRDLFPAAMVRSDGEGEGETGLAEYPVPDWASVTGRAFSRFSRSLDERGQADLAADMAKVVEGCLPEDQAFSIDILFQASASRTRPRNDRPHMPNMPGREPPRHGISGAGMVTPGRIPALPDLENLAAYLSVNGSGPTARDIHLDFIRAARQLDEMRRLPSFHVRAPLPGQERDGGIGPSSGETPEMAAYGEDRYGDARCGETDRGAASPNDPCDGLAAVLPPDDAGARLHVEDFRLEEDSAALAMPSFAGGPSGERLFALERRLPKTDPGRPFWVIVEKGGSLEQGAVAGDPAGPGRDDAQARRPGNVAGAFIEGRITIDPSLRGHGLGSRLAMTALLWEAALAGVGDTGPHQTGTGPHQTGTGTHRTGSRDAPDAKAGDVPCISLLPLHAPSSPKTPSGIRSMAFAMELDTLAGHVSRLLHRRAADLSKIGDMPQADRQMHLSQFPWAEGMPSPQPVRFDLDIEAAARQDAGREQVAEGTDLSAPPDPAGSSAREDIHG